MEFPELDTDIKSGYTFSRKSQATITGETLRPESGFSARDILDSKQLSKVRKMRSRKLKTEEQQARFIQD